MRDDYIRNLRHVSQRDVVSRPRSISIVGSDDRLSGWSTARVYQELTTACFSALSGMLFPAVPSQSLIILLRKHCRPTSETEFREYCMPVLCHVKKIWENLGPKSQYRTRVITCMSKKGNFVVGNCIFAPRTPLQVFQGAGVASFYTGPPGRAMPSMLHAECGDVMR